MPAPYEKYSDLATPSDEKYCGQEESTFTVHRRERGSANRLGLLGVEETKRDAAPANAER